MPALLKRLARADDAALAALWQAATDLRRERIGLEPLTDAALLLQRPGSFGVGIFDGANEGEGGDPACGRLVSAAVALPALADDARSQIDVPGLAHIASVVTEPSRWAEGLGGRVVRAVMLQAVRRGFSRAQLWTRGTNAGAQRLYAREGFVRSGRERTEHLGEQIVHYLRDLPLPPTRSRPAARLLCLDADERLLLLHFRDPSDGHQLWEPPGGGTEAGESPLEAVVREWGEETGLPVPRIEPMSTYVARDLVWRAERWVGDEQFFLARLPSVGTPILDENVDQEMDAYIGSSWVPWRNLETLEDPVEPDLLPVLRRLDPSGPWAGSHA
jgi:8-oxo-dGTP pyrophosphatase MutT (NUDIX family)/GNAT superfamily N-acetyltransferase